MKRIVTSVVAVVASLTVAEAGFRTPESLVRNVYAYYGKGAPDLSTGLPRNEATAQKFFDPTLRSAWLAPRTAPYDFMVQSPTWQLGPVAVSILRKQFDKTYVTASFVNEGHSVTLNFILVQDRDGWVITDIESSHDSLRMFLEQFRN